MFSNLSQYLDPHEKKMSMQSTNLKRLKSEVNQYRNALGFASVNRAVKVLNETISNPFQGDFINHKTEKQFART